MNQLFILFKRIVVWVLVLFYFTFTFSQSIENIKFSSQDKNIVITYDLINCSSDEKYDISIVFLEKTTNRRIVPKTMIGDLKKQVCGKKHVFWESSKDISTLSGNYYPELKFKKSFKGPTDPDGYEYKTVKIGNQEWFAENLRTSKYNDGTPISKVTDINKWSKLTTGAWCYYNNDPLNNIKYGKLYNWYAVKRIKNKNICPKGWHVPSDADWSVITDYLGGESFAGGKMKEVDNTSWNYPNSDATNTSEFTGLPGGYRDGNGSYEGFGNYGYWWGSQYSVSANILNPYLLSYNGGAYGYFGFKNCGFSVRCLRD